MTRVGRVALILLILYLLLGLLFHWQWKQAQHACADLLRSRGEYVEPEVFPVLGVFFDMTWWPVYVAANMYHTGRVFATPCDDKRRHDFPTPKFKKREIPPGAREGNVPTLCPGMV